MKLGEIVTGRAGSVFDAPTKSVKFKLIGSKANGDGLISEAEAVLAFVPEDQRTEARINAEKAMRKQFPDGNIPEDLLSDERVYHLLHKSLKDSDDHRQPFASSVDELKRFMHRRTILDLATAYEQFCADEFPEVVEDDVFEQLVAEAKKKSLGDLISSYEPEKILRALPSLVAAFGKSQPETSGDGKHG